MNAAAKHSVARTTSKPTSKLKWAAAVVIAGGLAYAAVHRNDNTNAAQAAATPERVETSDEWAAECSQAKDPIGCLIVKTNAAAPAAPRP